MSGDGARWEDARGAWPGVELDRAVFEAHVAALGAELEIAPALLGDVYLACACARGVPAALAAFERAFVARVPEQLARVERDPAVVDEVMQRLRERLLVDAPDRPARIREFRGRGSLAAWVRICAIRVHADLASEHGRAVPIDDEDDGARLGVLAVGADLAIARAEHRASIQAALAEALRDLPARERTMLRMHYVDGLSMDRIGRLYRVDKATVSRWLRAARERIADEALARVEARTGVTAEEARSLLGLLMSTIDLSLPGLLGATGS